MSLYVDSRNFGVMSHVEFQNLVLEILVHLVDAFDNFSSNHFLLRRLKRIVVVLDAEEFDCRPFFLMLILVH
ncbi:unnamed protein product [Meloidogyne enterolobii]|uniref:Uncharacterized protein n=1 Tax=Meloidogyne enterolobii TaxID=390850 RepID=A0ACB0Y2A5_MELEN